MKGASKPERAFRTQLKWYKLDKAFVSEYKFLADRKFRFDFADPKRKIAVEIEGGLWRGNFGRHTNPIGYAKDMEKYNLAALNGWRVFRFSSNQVEDGSAIGFITSNLYEM